MNSNIIIIMCVVGSSSSIIFYIMGKADMSDVVIQQG